MGVSNYFSLKLQLWEFLWGEVPNLPTLKMRMVPGKTAHLWATLPGREATSTRPKLPVLTANRPRSLLPQIPLNTKPLELKLQTRTRVLCSSVQ
jgi:hypothetical protein